MMRYSSLKITTVVRNIALYDKTINKIIKLGIIIIIITYFFHNSFELNLINTKNYEYSIRITHIIFSKIT